MRRTVIPMAAVLLAAIAAPVARADGGGDVSANAAMTRSPVGGGGATAIVFKITDNGPGSALGVILDFTAPEGVAVTGATGCAVQDRYVHCELGDYAEGQVGEVRIDLRGDVKGDYDLSGTLYTYSIDPNRENDTAHAQLQVTSTKYVPQGPGGSSSGGGGSGVLGASASSLHVKARRTQRILKTGGIAVSVTPGASGPVDVRATVSVPGHGPLRLARVWLRNATPGRATRVWLGTTPAMKRVLRAGFRRARILRAVVRVRHGGRTVLHRVYVTR